MEATPAEPKIKAMLKLYNSLSRKKEKFSPIGNDKVLIYVCGITPYDTTHLGHAFTYVFFDVLIRYLSFLGYKVIYVQNVTDIDDDILRKAKEVGKDWKDLGTFWTERFVFEMDKLNVLRPTNFVKATDSISLMIRIIRVLLERGFAYEKNGNVYFNITKFKHYGKLSCFTRKQMVLISKERGADPSDSNKKDPLDFILWRSASWRTKPNEPSWDSPWSFGRPGWHIECSAMINEYLGDRIDIHGGGRDLIFPHHESEIAQSESYTGKKPFSRFFMHTAMVMYKGEKMAKSLGNLVMVRDLLKKYSTNEIRFVLLSHHYREPWEFDKSEFKTAKNNLEVISKAIFGFKSGLFKSKDKYINPFINEMNDDIDTSMALLYLVNLAESINKENVKTKKLEMQYVLSTALKVLGFSGV